MTQNQNDEISLGELREAVKAGKYAQALLNLFEENQQLKADKHEAVQELEQVKKSQ